jgi:F-type H+-transporting ATPase subunit gamma
MYSVLGSLAKNVESGHPLLEVREVKKLEILVFSADRGLCGGFNTNIMKAANKLAKQSQAEGKEWTVSSIGKKATDLFKRRKAPLRMSWAGLSGKINYGNAQAIAKDVMDKYIAGDFDEVWMIYTEFKSAGVQKVIEMKLLPLMAAGDSADDTSEVVSFEPSEEAIFDQLLPKNIEVQVFRALLDSAASEEAARMAAMENATKSADDMIKRLTLKYNKARQTAITTELMDIVGGVEALKK